MESSGASNEPVYEIKHKLPRVCAGAQKQSSSASSARASSTGVGYSAAGYKEPSEYSIYKAYGGQMIFLHSHGLKLHHPGDIVEGKRIVAELKREMQEAAQAPAKSNTDYSCK